MEPKTARPGAKGADRILIEPQRAESVFGRRIGPTDDCYAIRDVVNLFRWGATKDDVIHLCQCPSCRQWVDNFARRPSVSLTEKATVGGLFATVADFLRGKIHREPPPLPALLYLRDGDVVVEEVSRPGASLEFVLMAGIPENRQLDATSLKLEGAIIGHRATIQRGGPDWNLSCPLIRFNEVQVAEPLQKDIYKHVAVTDAVSLSGRFLDDPTPGFRGQAYVRLVRAEAAINPQACRFDS
jgi:hypothetical protein